MDDIRAVMDAAGTQRAVLLGIEDGFALTALFAATYPERTIALIAYGATARTAWATDYPFGMSPEEYASEIADIERGWGTRELVEDWMPYVFPDRVGDEETIEQFGSWMRSGGGPGDAVAWYEVDWELDVREVLPAIRVPTLVLHRVGDLSVSIENGRYLAEHIAGATMIELPGAEHGWTVGKDVPDAVGAFVGQLRREEAEFDRVLASVLFTDIVGSTTKAADLGDRDWRALVERHHAVSRGLLGRYRGTEMDTAGDGFYRDVRRAGARRPVRAGDRPRRSEPLGIEVRAGVHTGEVRDDRQQVSAGSPSRSAHAWRRRPAPSEVLVSQTVKDLVAGSGLTFDDAGEHELKGVPDRWHLYRVVE